ncbi:MAG: hypothetical protein ACK4ZH_11180 [Dolichospermum sp.]
MTREQGTGNREQGTGKRLRRERQPNGFRQLYFSLLMSVFFAFSYLNRHRCLNHEYYFLNELVILHYR